MTDTVSNKDLYEAIESLEKKMVHRVELIETNVLKHDRWINQITGKVTVIMVFIGIGINWAWDMLLNRKQ